MALLCRRSGGSDSIATIAALKALRASSCLPAAFRISPRRTSHVSLRSDWRSYHVQSSQRSIVIIHAQLQINCCQFQRDQWPKLLNAFVESAQRFLNVTFVSSRELVPVPDKVRAPEPALSARASVKSLRGLEASSNFGKNTPTSYQSLDMAGLLPEKSVQHKLCLLETPRFKQHLSTPQVNDSEAWL